MSTAESSPSPSLQVLALDHVQLAMPFGQEDQARAFFAGTLGMKELPKPGSGVGKGGCWFRAGPVEIHLGVDPEFRPARKAHPALVVADLAAVCAALGSAGIAITPGGKLVGRERVFAADCFGNRMEWIQLDR